MSVPSVVNLKINGAKAYLEINRPDALNAINSQVIAQLDRALDELVRNAGVQVVILSGAGEKAFAAGADIKEMQNLTSSEAADFSREGAEVFTRLENLPVPVLAKVQGWALGGGLELAMACDFIFASAKARFGLPEVSLGLIPGFGGTQRLARRIGIAKAMEWVTTGEKYSAEDAFHAGLVNRVVSPEELNAFVEKAADAIVKNGPEAVRVVKRILRKTADSTFDVGQTLESSAFGLRFGTEEAKEGMGAFCEKRAPQFKKGQ